MPLLSVEGIGVRFGGVMALEDVDIDADGGYVTGLIGPNGAGKTTLFNVVTGLQDPMRGRVRIDGKDVTSSKAHRRARLGVGRTFQRLETFGSLTARENVLVAAEIKRRWSRDGSAPKAVAEEIIDRVGIRAFADERCDNLPTGRARLVELARTLATRPRLLLLDEPGSGLDTTETEAFGELLVSLAGDGLAILLVEHDVELVMAVCRRIHVLDFGRVIATGTPTEVQRNPMVQAAYLGEDEQTAGLTDAAEQALEPVADDAPAAPKRRRSVLGG